MMAFWVPFLNNVASQPLVNLCRPLLCHHNAIIRITTAPTMLGLIKMEFHKMSAKVMAPTRFLHKISLSHPEIKLIRIYYGYVCKPRATEWLYAMCTNGFIYRTFFRSIWRPKILGIECMCVFVCISSNQPQLESPQTPIHWQRTPHAIVMPGIFTFFKEILTALHLIAKDFSALCFI